ncbi:MAG: tetratricopeptide repeat protein [Rhodospirillales bacterium]|nr:tetratricopeptide repeat protein [Rhodospirillales bacterium]
MADLEHDPLIREIEEDLREEKLTKLWKAYGNWIIGACVALVVGVAVGEGWKHYQKGAREEAGDRFAQALLLADTDPAAAVERLSEVSRDAPEGIGMLSRFRAAALVADGDDPVAAADAFKSLPDATEDPLYRDLAVILEAMNEMAAMTTPTDSGALIDRLSPLAADDRPWRNSARELIAYLSWGSGDLAKAKELFQALADDPLTSSGMRSRAGDMLTVISQ